MHVFIHLCMYSFIYACMGMIICICTLGNCACTGARNTYACVMRICAYIYINEKWHIKAF